MSFLSIPTAQENFEAPVSGGTGGWTWVGSTENTLGATNNGGSITIPKDGYYAISVMVTGSNNSGNSNDNLVITLTGSSHGQLDHRSFPMTTTAASGFVHFHGFLSNGETVSVSASTSFDAVSVSGIGVITFTPVMQFRR